MTGDALLCCDGSDGWRLTLRRLAPQRLKVMLTPQDVWADGSLVSGLERLVEAAFARRTALEEPLLPAHPFTSKVFSLHHTRSPGEFGVGAARQGDLGSQELAPGRALQLRGGPCFWSALRAAHPDRVRQVPGEEAGWRPAGERQGTPSQVQMRSLSGRGNRP